MSESRPFLAVDATRDIGDQVKILLISTRGYNPGDEFIRFGQQYLLSKLFPNAIFNVAHKHDPRTLFAGFQLRARTPSRLISPWLYHLYAATSGHRRENYLESAELVVFAGTPFIWRANRNLLRSTSANAEWVKFTWRRLIEQFPQKPVLNIAAGTSADVSRLGEIFRDGNVRDFVARAVQRSALTTVRERYSATLLKELGFDVALLPCTSILAAKGAGYVPQEPQYVVINLMPGAVHTWHERLTGSVHWKQTITAVVPEIEKRHAVLFVSHSAEEDAVVKEWFPGRLRSFSKDPRELLQVYAHALYGICNRVHSAAAIASFGRPVILIGGDSRVDLIAQFGQPALDFRAIDAKSLANVVLQIERDYSRWADRLQEASARTEHEHLRLIRTALLKTFPSIERL